MFAQGSVSSKSSTGKRIPPFKLIVLDEADSLTSAAQVRSLYLTVEGSNPSLSISISDERNELVFIHSL